MPAEGDLVKGSGPAVYIIQNGERRWIPNPETFNLMGFDWDAIQTISDDELNAIPQGPDIPSDALVRIDQLGLNAKGLPVGALDELANLSTQELDLLADINARFKSGALGEAAQEETTGNILF